MTERSRDAVIIPYHIRKEQEDERRLKTLEAKVERLQRYDEMLTKVMPPDFKDWHQNSREEWPLVAALTIDNLTAQSDWAHEELSKAQTEVEQLTAREKALTEALRSLYDVACRIQEAIIVITASDELDVDAVLDWLVVPSNQAKTALAGEGGEV